MKNNSSLFNILFWFEAFFGILILSASLYTLETIIYLSQTQQILYIVCIISNVILLIALLGIYMRRKWGITILFISLLLVVCMDLYETYLDLSKFGELPLFEILIYASVNTYRTIFIGIFHIIAWIAVLLPIKSSFK